MTEETIFAEALERRTPADRAAYLDGACAGDPALRARVEALLGSHEGGTDFLDVPAVEQAARVAPAGSLDETQAASGVGRPADWEPLDYLGAPTRPGDLGRLGHYDVMEVVGRGGMGVVLRAFDAKLHRVVAIKVMAAELAAAATARKRFSREAQAAAAVVNEHVVTIHAVEEDHRPPYLVMQFVEGVSLQEKIDREGALGLREVLRIGMQAAEGLAAAHKQGLVHRDIKPANILLENGVERVKITDFGLARAADDASLTQSGVIAGTPLYMSPEQAEGHPLDHRSDLFSLGSVLYAACTGRAPFRAGSAVAVLRRVCGEAPRPIHEVNPAIPEWLCAIIDRLHAKVPADRYQSAAEVAALLGRRLARLQRPEHLPDDPTGEFAAPAARPVAPRRGRRRALAAAALLAVLIGAGLTEAIGVTHVAGTAIRLFSPEGTLVVEVDDPGVSVAVEGSDVVITGAGAKEIRLKPGQYQVRTCKHGKLLRQELVNVTRDGRQVVRITQEPPPPGVKVAKAPVEATAWERSVADLPDDEKEKAVIARLRALNPGWIGPVEDSRRKYQLDLYICGPELHDISPVRAMPGLRRLNVDAANFSDISPLHGMKLTRLALHNTVVSDLSPLHGMDLRLLNLTGSRRVTDLSPLRGMPLEDLTVAYTEISDLAPLKGMKLKHLNCDGSRVSDLSPLRGMPLEWLNLNRTQVSDLAVLKDLHLKRLNLDYRPDCEGPLRSLKGLEQLNDKPVADFWRAIDAKAEPADAWLERVRGLPAEAQAEAVAARFVALNPGFDGKVTPTIEGGVVTGLAFCTDEVTDLAPARALAGLKGLNARGRRLADLAPLRGLPLRSLDLVGNPARDLSPLRGMPLEILDLRATAATDLAPLRGMRTLRRLSVIGTPVRDLAPLEGLPLEELLLNGCKVADLSPLKGMPLRLLQASHMPAPDLDLAPLAGMRLQVMCCDDTSIREIAVLKGMPLEVVWCSFRPDRDAEVLRSIPTLKTINGKPAADFWKEVDAPPGPPTPSAR